MLLLMFALIVFAVAALLPAVALRSVPALVPAMAAFYGVIGIAGGYAYTRLEMPRNPIEERLYDVPLDLPTTTGAFLICAGALVVGGMLATAVLSPDPGDVMHGRLPTLVTLQLTLRRVDWRVYGLAALVPLVLYVTGTGLTNLWFAEAYAPEHVYPTAVKLGFATLPLGIVASAVLAQGGIVANRTVNVLGCGALVLYTTVVLAVASRMIALIPLAVLLALKVGRAQHPMRTAMVVLPVLSVCSIALPLYIRSQAVGISTLPSLLTESYWQQSSVDASVVANNILFAYPLANFVIDERTPIGALGAALSPLPSALSDYAAYEFELRVNYHVPYSAIGELFAAGPVIGGLYFLVAGFVFAGCWLGSHMFPALPQAVIRIATVAFAVLFMVQSIQYNLRSVTRLEYYLITIVVVAIANEVLQTMRWRVSWRTI